MSRHMTKEELEALYNAPSYQKDAPPQPAPQAYEPAAWDPWEPELPPEQQAAPPPYDPLMGRQVEAYNESLHRETLAHQRRLHEQAMENMRYRQAMDQLSGPPPLAPLPLNEDYFAQTRGFLIGFVVGAMAAGIALAYKDRFWRKT